MQDISCALFAIWPGRCKHLQEAQHFQGSISFFKQALQHLSGNGSGRLGLDQPL